MGETPSVVPLPDGGIAAPTLRRRRHTDSTPRAPPRTPVRDALSSPGRSPRGGRRRRAFARPASSRTRVGPFAGDERCVHHRSRVFVTRSPVGRRALASSSREPPLRESSASCVLMIERCVRPTSAHPRILKRAPIVSCGDRVSSAPPGRDGTSCDATSWLELAIERPVRTAFSRRRARFGGSGPREIGRFLPVLRAYLRSTSDAPVAVPRASRRDFARDKASGSAEIVSLPHVVKTYGAPRSEASPPTRRFLFRVAV